MTPAEIKMILECIPALKGVGFTVASGLNLIGIGFIIQQVRFWRRGTPTVANGMASDMKEAKEDIKNIYNVITEQGKNISWIMGKLED